MSKSYASLTQVKGRLAIPVATTTHDNDIALALVCATRAVDIAIGDLDVAADDTWNATNQAADMAVEATATAALVMATIDLAVRIYRGPDVPFGVAGMSDGQMVAYVRSWVPEAELLLAGQRVSWGIA